MQYNQNIQAPVLYQNLPSPAYYPPYQNQVPNYYPQHNSSQTQIVIQLKNENNYNNQAVSRQKNKAISRRQAEIQ
jgi:hypothetical protein